MKTISLAPTDIPGNLIERIAKQWMLVAAGEPHDFNFLTASWGAFGMLWFQPTATAYIRTSRHTKRFLDASERFSLTFLKPGHQTALTQAGTLSGRDVDKVQETGLTPVFLSGVPAFGEAELTIVCKKLYVGHLDPNALLDQELRAKAYGADPAEHAFYIGAVEEVLQTVDE